MKKLKFKRITTKKKLNELLKKGYKIKFLRKKRKPINADKKRIILIYSYDAYNKGLAHIDFKKLEYIGAGNNITKYGTASKYNTGRTLHKVYKLYYLDK